MNVIAKEVLIALSKVFDPDLKKDLVTLGMIENIIIEGNVVKFKVVLTTPACPLKNKIRQDCIDAVKKHFGNDVVAEPEMTSRVSSSVIPSSKKDLLPEVKNIIMVVSGKGGVGKSTIAANLAVALAKTGAIVGLVDADIYGPSVPVMFGLKDEKPQIIQKGEKNMMVPIEKYGVKLISIGFLVDPEKALIWRGPMASNALKQLFSDTEWGELDYLIVDTPPGTGDIHLTLVQSLPIAGVTIVTTPQEVALADARKAINMYRQNEIKVPILGIIENMSFFTPAELPENKYFIFGKGGGEKLAENYSLPLLGKIPLVQSVCSSGDEGIPAAIDPSTPTGKAFSELAQMVSQQLSIWNAFIEITDVNPCK